MDFSEEVQATSRSQLRYEQRKSTIYQTKLAMFTKRLFDIVFSLLFIILLAPLLIGISYWIYKKEGRPIFKRQLTAGKNKRTFMMWTFRTMTNPSKVIFSLPVTNIPKNMNWEHNHRDIQLYTCTGVWLKRLKLYKLPQLYHVLKGDMSFVGPQPTDIKIDEPYSQLLLRRVTFRPGIVSCKHDRINSIVNDLYYIHHWSLLFDLKIVYRTVCQQLSKPRDVT